MNNHLDAKCRTPYVRDEGVTGARASERGIASNEDEDRPRCRRRAPSDDPSRAVNPFRG